jgi:hypothetical protein
VAKKLSRREGTEGRNRFLVRERRPHAERCVKKREKQRWGETTDFHHPLLDPVRKPPPRHHAPGRHCRACRCHLGAAAPLTRDGRHCHAPSTLMALRSHLGRCTGWSVRLTAEHTQAVADLARLAMVHGARAGLKQQLQRSTHSF